MDTALLDSIRSGDRRALSRAISLVEGDGQMTGLDRASRVLGITGPPGAGKSTLISALVEVIRSNGQSAAVLAVDPSSPLTGGALLGDRIRMQGHVDDDGVYVRSMATRGHLGGLARASGEALALMRAAGFDWVIVETVGVGQSEVEVMEVADVVVLVVAPGWGDQVQADKAGVVEIADLFVVNKGDLPGAEAVARALREAAEAGGHDVMVTSANTGEGVSGLLDRVAGLLG